MTVTLGDEVKDIITGHRGIVIGKTEYLFDCVSFLVKSQKLKDGKPIKPDWFDEDQLAVVKAGTFTREGKAKPVRRKKLTTGGPRDDHPSRETD